MTQRYMIQALRVAVVDTAEGRCIAECSSAVMAEAICEVLNGAAAAKRRAEERKEADAMLLRREDHKIALARPVDDLELSIRAYNGLRNEGCSTVEDVIQFSKADLLRMPNFGKRSLAEVEAVLAEMGLSLSAVNKGELLNSVAAIGLNIRTSNALLNGYSNMGGELCRINTVGELCQHSIKDLQRVPNIGKAALREIVETLARMGLCLSATDREVTYGQG